MSSKLIFAAIAIAALIGCGSTEEHIYLMTPDGTMIQTDRMNPKVQELEKLTSRDMEGIISTEDDGDSGYGGGSDCTASCYASQGYCTCSGARACCHRMCSGCFGY